MLIDALKSFGRSFSLPHRARPRRSLRKRRAQAVERLEDRTVLSAVTFFRKFEGIDWTSAAAGGVGSQWNDGGSATLTVGGVQGQIVSAYLYWRGVDLLARGGNGVYDNSTAAFNGVSVTGVSLGTGGTGTWGSGSSQAFRADVTSLVQAGLTTYSVSGLAAKTGHSADGVSLVIVYQDGVHTNDRDLYVLDGNDVNVGPAADGPWDVHLDGLVYRTGDVRAELHVADGQTSTDAAIRFASPDGSPVDLADRTGRFDGSSVPNFGKSRAINGSLWDVHRFDVTPAVGAPGTHSLALTQGAASSDSLSLILLLVDTAAKPANEPPVARDLSLTIAEDTSLTSVLDIHDPQADSTLSFTLVSGPAAGAVTLDSVGGFVYIPPKDFFGTVTFSYAASDGEFTASAVVTITVTSVNDVPAVLPQSFATAEDTLFSGRVAASDDDGDVLSFALASGPGHGVVVLAADGTYVYTPDRDWNGRDAFQVAVTDGQSDPVIVSVSLDVEPVNDVPVAPPQSVTTAEDAALSGQVAASDADGDVLSFLLVDGPAHGSLVLAADGSYVFTPARDWNGEDSFRVSVTDGYSDPVTALITLHVAAANDGPVATGGEFRVGVASPVGAVVGRVVAADVDGDVLVYNIVAGNTGGAFAIDPNTGLVTVADRKALAASSNQVVSLTVQVADGHGGVASVVVKVQVQPAAVQFSVGKPGSPAVIDLKGLRWQPLVIYSTDTFDVRQIDVGSLTFGRTGAERSLLLGHGKSHPVAYIDVNGDGRKDLVLLFDATATGLTAGNTAVTLKGQLKDGTGFVGTAPVTVQAKPDTKAKANGNGKR